MGKKVLSVKAIDKPEQGVGRRLRKEGGVNA